MANVTVTDNSVLPKDITILEDGRTLTIAETKETISIVNDRLTVTESPAALNDISDVNITSLTDNQILVYDSASSKWVNEDNAGGGGGAVDSVNGQTGTVVLDTDDISEGSTNLYYADSLVDAHLTGGTGVTYSAGDISIGQPVATTDDVEFNEVTAAEFIGNLRGANLMKAQAGEALTKGDVVYISGISGNTPVVSKADADDSTKMPAVGLANATVSSSANVDVLTFGQITNIDTTQNIGGTWAEGDSLYVNTTAGQLTKTQPTGETSQVQKIAKIEKVHASTGILLIQGAGRSNATPNLNDGNIFIGNASNYAETVDLDTKITALGYIKSETDSQTLSFSSPDLTISNGNTVDISALTTGFITASSTDTLTNKSGNVSQFTNDANYLQQNVSTANTLADVNYSTTPTNGQTLVWDSLNSYWEPGTASGGGISEVKDDTTPQLGGDLDVLGQNIFSSTSIVNVNDGLQIGSGNTLRLQNTSQTQTVTIGATNTSTGYNLQLPTTAPSNDQYLTVNSSGQISFTNIPTIPSTTDDLTEGSTNLYYTDARVQAVSINALDEDASPQLSSSLDANGNNITDSTRAYVIVGNNNSPSSSDYDSMSGGTPGQRVEGPITIGESSGGTDRFHGNPRLNLHTLTADRTDSNARFRMNYVEGVLDTAGFDTTQTGFGRGHHGMFLSGKVRNSGASASTVNQARAITMSPQIDGLTSNVTVDDMRACEVRPFIASGGTVNNMYGIHYSISGSGTVGGTTHYSFYGAESSASAYNAGGFTPGAFASTALPSGLPNGTIISISDNGHKPAYNDGGTWKYVADDSSV